MHEAASLQEEIALLQAGTRALWFSTEHPHTWDQVAPAGAFTNVTSSALVSRHACMRGGDWWVGNFMHGLLPCVLWAHAELAESEAQEVGVNQLHAALEKAREDLLKVEKEAEEATVQARASKEELLAAEREYECLLQWSTSDPEFVRLQAELGQHRQGGLEEVCGRLRKELEAVQEEYYAQRWRRTQGGGGSGSHLGGGDREHSQMHRHGVQRQCVSGRRDCDNSLSSNPVEDSADLTAAKEGVWSVPLSGQGSTSCTPPNVMGGVETFSRVLSPWQQATHSSHQSSHSKHIAKTGPFGGSWKRPSGAVPATKDFTPAAVCM